MKRGLFFLILISLFFSIASFAQEKEAKVLIETEMGNIVVKLYNETPKHRDNFLKLVDQGFYDESLFHRVINNFMIQGGDPDSKTAEPGIALGNGGTGYTIPAEFNDSLFHKKGALCAARQGDQVNPKKESSGCQFYIVQGKKYSKEDMIRQQRYKVFDEYVILSKDDSLINQVNEAKKTRNWEVLNNLVNDLAPQLDSLAKVSPLVFNYTDEQLTTYEEIGGTPHLDGGYTVFGEVTEGLDVIDKIAQLAVDPRSRPIRDIKMTMKILK